jgi:hypothetical protein
MSDEEQEEESVTVCTLITDVAWPMATGSVARKCEECERDIWASPTTLARKNTHLLCTYCGVEKLAGEEAPEIMPPTAGTRDELRKSGLTDQEIDNAWAAITANPHLMIPGFIK